jgi:hypothetical protein
MPVGMIGRMQAGKIATPLGYPPLAASLFALLQRRCPSESRSNQPRRPDVAAGVSILRAQSGILSLDVRWLGAKPTAQGCDDVIRISALPVGSRIVNFPDVTRFPLARSSHPTGPARGSGCNRAEPFVRDGNRRKPACRWRVPFAGSRVPRSGRDTAGIPHWPCCEPRG